MASKPTVHLIKHVHHQSTWTQLPLAEPETQQILRVCGFRYGQQCTSELIASPTQEQTAYVVEHLRQVESKGMKLYQRKRARTSGPRKTR